MKNFVSKAAATGVKGVMGGVHGAAGLTTGLKRKFIQKKKKTEEFQNPNSDMNIKDYTRKSTVQNYQIYEAQAKAEEQGLSEE